VDNANFVIEFDGWMETVGFVQMDIKETRLLSELVVSEFIAREIFQPFVLPLFESLIELKS